MTPVSVHVKISKISRVSSYHNMFVLGTSHYVTGQGTVEQTQSMSIQTELDGANVLTRW